jgi:muramoyltetrapeptide carboxypeptidase
LGGCLHSITHLIGTEYWPDHHNKILFFELPEGEDISKGEPLAEVDAQLADLEIAGIFKEIKGLIVGRPFKYSDEENKKLKEVILENTKDYDFPILYGADFGHTDPQITIPLGCISEIDSEKNKFKIN